MAAFPGMLLPPDTGGGTMRGRLNHKPATRAGFMTKGTPRTPREGQGADGWGRWGSYPQLERMLVMNGIGKQDDIAKAKETAHGLGLFVRTLIGLDREAAKGALATFLNGKNWTANQIEFVNLIINYLTEHGVMEAALLYESPFTDLTPKGPDGLFTSKQVDELMAVLERVRGTAVAA